MKVQQLDLFPSRIVSPSPDTIDMDAACVKSAIEYLNYPATSKDLENAMPSMSKDRIYAALCLLHKQGEIGWVSRATFPPVSRATQEVEPAPDNDSEVARPIDDEGSPTVKVKAFKKAGSELYYNYVCWGKEKSQRAYLGGGNVETHLAQVYKAIAEEAILEGRFEGCQTRTDYYRVIGELKSSEVDF